jgi:hypothetical protein
MIGDATCDRAPLQIGQFESGIEINQDLAKLWLEGGRRRASFSGRKQDRPLADLHCAESSSARKSHDTTRASDAHL